MVAYNRKNLNCHLPIAGAAAVGVIAAASVALMPADLLETLVWRSGVAALVPVAQPPLGVTARVVLTLGGGVLSAAVVWSALYLVFGPGGVFDLAHRRVREDGVPVVRRADAHPDAPPRKPLSAADLGTPMMEAPTVERLIPRDLDQPLAAFDPHAILPVPMEPARPVAPLAVVAETTPQFARIETFDLPPIVATRPVVAEPSGAKPSIEALLRRLEQGAGRRRMAAG